MIHSEAKIKQPLTIKVENDQLSITIGLDTLCHSMQYHPDLEDCRITDSILFAKGIAKELLESDEEGNTKLHTILDDAAFRTYENGNQSIKKYKP